MDAEEYRRIAQQLSRPEDRAAMIKVAALWMERAEEVEQRDRIVQQQPEKEPQT